MCGGNEKDVYDPRRFGALAIVKAGAGSSGDFNSEDLSGQVAFFNGTDRESHVATHVRFIPNETGVADLDLDLTIFSTGDLTLPSSECKRVESFILSRHSSGDVTGEGPLEWELRHHLLLSVGDCGIIGRRVAIRTRGVSNSCVAEGIVGFNTGMSEQN